MCVFFSVRVGYDLFALFQISGSNPIPPATPSASSTVPSSTSAGTVVLLPTCTVWITIPFSVKQLSCNRNVAFRFHARFILHISVFTFAVWAKLFYARATVKNGGKNVVHVRT